MGTKANNLILQTITVLASSIHIWWFKFEIFGQTQIAKINMCKV